MLNKENVINAINSTSNLKDAAKALNVTERTLYTYRKKYDILNLNGNKEAFTITQEPETINQKIEKEKIDSKLNDLRNENKKLLKELALKDEQIQGIWDVKNSFDFRGTGNPDWLKYTKGSNLEKSIPTLFCSDEHWGEVVNPAQVNKVNEYNSVIARKRYNNLINNYLSVLNEHLQNVDCDRMILALGGDNISGDIHDELSLTNDLTTMEAVYDYVEHKEKGIKELLASGFKQIFIPCVRGNHDRNTEKTHSKNILETSSAYLVYMFLQKIFAGDKRIQFSIARGMDCLYQVNNHRMLLTHGDQFKGGNGIGGITIPILRGFYKKQANYAQTGNNFDSLAIGHFHQFTSINNGQVIINGTLKGFDEYSQKMGFSYQEPCQSMWLTHSQRGITIQLPIYCEEKKDKEFRKEDWVSWKN